MSNFTYADYQSAASKAANNTGVKVGFFKLADGAEALVRFNIGAVEDLHFASVHKPIFGQRFTGLPGFGGISCLNEFGSKENKCPLCTAVTEGHPVVDKAKKSVFVQLLVSYKDMTTGTWTAPAPVIWERPAGFSKEIATILNEYGDLRTRLFKISRVGASTDTRYTILPVDKDSPVFKQEMIPANFSVFETFDIARHSYWKKTAEELNEYLTTGTFPEIQKQQAPAAPQVQTQPAYTAAPAQQPVQQPVYQAAPVQPAQAPQVDRAPWEAPVQPAPQPEKPATRNFSGFSF